MLRRSEGRLGMNTFNLVMGYEIWVMGEFIT